MGWLKWTLIIIGIIFVLLGITAYQIYGFVKYIEDEAPDLQENMEKLNGGDCSRLDDVQDNVYDLIWRANSLCANPIIRIGIDFIEEAPIKCEDVDDIDDAMEDYLNLMDKYCNTGETPTEDEVREVIEQMNKITGN